MLKLLGSSFVNFVWKVFSGRKYLQEVLIACELFLRNGKDEHVNLGDKIC